MRRLLPRLRRRCGRAGRARFEWLVIGAFFVLTRLVALGAMELGGTHVHPRYRGVWERREESLYVGAAPGPWLEPLVRWDALYYVSLARQGYPAPGDGLPFHVAFFPLYPLAVASLDRLIGNTFAAALALSNLCALLLAVVLCRVGTALGARGAGLRAALLLLALPGSHFLSLPYTESLFALLTAGAMLAMLREHPLAAALLGAAASGTRAPGAVVAVMLVAHAWQHRRSARRAATWLLASVVALAGIAAYALFLQLRYGDALGFVHIQAAWGRHTSLLGPLRAFTELHFDPDYYLVALGALAGAIALSVRRGFRLEQRLGAWTLLLLPLATGSLKSIIRFQSVNVPLVAGAGRLLRGRVFEVVLALSLALMAWEAFRFGAGFANN